MARVLVVDDSTTVRQMMALTLRSRRHQVTEVEDGNQAMAALEASAFDLIVLDVNMPVMTGLEVLAQVRERGLTVPIVMVTTESERPSIERAMSLGATDYVPKPFKPTELLRRLEALLG